MGTCVLTAVAMEHLAAANTKFWVHDVPVVGWRPPDPYSPYGGDGHATVSVKGFSPADETPCHSTIMHIAFYIAKTTTGDSPRHLLSLLTLAVIRRHSTVTPPPFTLFWQV